MAVMAKSTNPALLLEAIKKAIKEGAIETWSCDEDGDFTHSPPQWSHEAWFRPFIEDGVLAFYIFPPKETYITTRIYAIYHGRLIEMLLAHFDSEFTEVMATSSPDERDIIK